MFGTVLDSIKSYWKYVVGVAAISVVAIGSVLRMKKQEQSDQKESHDNFKKGQDSVIEADAHHDERVAKAAIEFENKNKDIEKEKEERIAELTSLKTEDLSKALAEKYNIKIEDKKP
jgi:hypothetical protein